jgi:pimeloyl-ACP methyl ester carboxylesterase
MATFVLVHGAWHGGWCWKKLTPLLRRAGHDVFTPTLTGLGERSHLLAPDIGLNTHIRDIVAVLEYEDLRGVVLVGHSSGGMVITAVADQVPDRLAHLVYLDGFLPSDGQAVFDIVTPDARASFEEQARAEGDGWRVPSFPLSRWGVTEDADVHWMSPRVGPQPIKHFTEPVQLSSSRPHGFARTYISCTGGTAPHFESIAKKVKADPGWRYRELQTGHDAMVTEPDRLADLLLECGRG